MYNCQQNNPNENPGLSVDWCVSHYSTPHRKESEMSHIIVIYEIKYCAFKHKPKLILNTEIFLIRQNIFNAGKYKSENKDYVITTVTLLYSPSKFFPWVHLPFTFLNKLYCGKF